MRAGWASQGRQASKEHPYMASVSAPAPWPVWVPVLTSFGDQQQYESVSWINPFLPNLLLGHDVCAGIETLTKTVKDIKKDFNYSLEEIQENTVKQVEDLKEEAQKSLKELQENTLLLNHSTKGSWPGIEGAATSPGKVTCCWIFSHIVNLKIVNWKNLFLAVVWLSPSTHL